MQGTAKKKVQIQFPAQRAQFGARSAGEDGLRDAQGATKTRDDSPYRRNFYLTSASPTK